MDVMMRLPSSSLDVLRNKFMSSAGGDGLILEEFVDAMLHYLPKPANEEECIKLVMELVDLYHQVDVNGDCFMSWDEFTSHCIEAGMLATRTVEKPLSVNFQYISDFKDPLNHRIVQEVQLIESLNAILVIESGSSAVKIIDATTLKLERILQVRRESTNGEMENHRFPIVSLVYAHDLQLLAICSADMSISFWTWDDFRSLGHIQSKAIRRMSYASNGTLYTTDDSGTVCMWKLRIKHFHGGPAQCVCIPHGSLKGHTSIVIAFAEVHRYGYFVTGGMDSQILLWDLETSRRKGALIKHKRAVSHLQYSKSMDLLLSGGYEHEIYCWDVYNKQIVLVLTGHHHPCIGLQLTYLSADDEQEHAVSCDASGTMKLWKLTRTASGEAAARQTFVADPDNGLYKPRMMLACGPRRVITASRELRLFEAMSTYVQDFLPFKALFNSVLDRFYVAIGKYIQVWCAVAGDMIDEWYHVSDSEISCMCFDDRERKVVFGNVNGRVIVLNAINGAIMKNVHLAEIAPSAALTGHLSAPMDATHPRAASDIAVNQIHYNKEDKCLIVLTSRSVFIFDEDATEEKADGVLLPLFRVAFDMHEYEITASAFSYELSLIATGSADKSIRIWEFQQLRLEGECIGHTGQVTAMSFVESYPLLVSADEDANLSIWTVRPSPRPYMRVVSVLCRSPRVRAAEGAQVHLPDAGVPEASRNNNAEANIEQDATRRRTSTTATGKNVSVAEGVETLNISPKHGGFRRRLNRRATVGSSKNLRIYFPSEDFDPVPVCCLEIQRSENGITLYTGDQRGDMKEWNLGLCLKDLGSEPLDPEKLPPSFEGYNASRHVELSYRYLFEDFDGFRADEHDNDTSGPEVEEKRRQKMLERKERKRRQERMRQKLLRIRKNIKSSETKIKARLPVLKLFAAHAENISSMQVIAMPESILTTSMDGNVRIWNHAGKRIGNLSMSANEVANVQKGLAKNVAYRFNLDINAKLWDRYDEAIRILQSVRAKYSLPRLLTRQTLAIRSPPEIDIDVHMRAEKFSGDIVRLGNTRVAKALALLLLADGQHREGRDAFDIDFTQTLDHHEMTAGILDSPTSCNGQQQRQQRQSQEQKCQHIEVKEDEEHNGKEVAPKNEEKDEDEEQKASDATLDAIAAEQDNKAPEPTKLPQIEVPTDPWSDTEHGRTEDRFSPLRNSYRSYELEVQRKRDLQDLQKHLRETKVDTTPSPLLRALLREEEEKATAQKQKSKQKRRARHLSLQISSSNASEALSVVAGSDASCESAGKRVQRSVSLPALPAAHIQERAAAHEAKKQSSPYAGRRVSVLDRASRRSVDTSRQSERSRRGAAFLEDIQEALEFVSASTEISRDSSRSSRSGESDNDRSSHKDQMFFSETFRAMGGHPSRATLNLEDGESLFQDIPETAEDSPTKGGVASIPDYRRRSMARVSFLMQDQQNELSQDASDSSLKTTKSGRHQRNLDGSIENVRRPSRQSILRRATLVSESRTSVISAATQRSMQRRRESTFANPNGPLLSGANSSDIGIYSKREILSHKILFDQMSDPSGKLVELEVLMDNVDKLSVDVEQLASMFDTLDTDGNGSISFSEMLRMFFVGASAEDLRAMEDFIEATYNNTEDNCNPVMTPADRKELRELFRLYDKDKGGTLSLIELFEVLNKREYKPRDQFGSDEDLLFSFADLERLTKKFNFTLDHELSEDEFIELMFDFQHTDVDYKS